MGLSFTGNSDVVENFRIRLEAYDGNTGVMVIATDDAIKDMGLDAVQQKASDKYSSGDTDNDGRVIVRTSDFANG